MVAHHMKLLLGTPQISQSGLNMIYISQCSFTVQLHPQLSDNYLEDGFKLYIDLVRHCAIKFYQCQVFDCKVNSSTYSILDLAAKAVIVELASYHLKISKFFPKKNKQYPILDMDSPGLSKDVLDMEDREYDVDQYKPELSMLEEESYDQESVDKLLSACVQLPRGDGLEHGTVLGRKCMQSGHLVFIEVLFHCSIQRIQSKVSRWLYPRISC